MSYVWHLHYKKEKKSWKKSRDTDIFFEGLIPNVIIEGEREREAYAKNSEENVSWARKSPVRFISPKKMWNGRRRDFRIQPDVLLPRILSHNNDCIVDWYYPDVIHLLAQYEFMPLFDRAKMIHLFCHVFSRDCELFYGFIHHLPRDCSIHLALVTVYGREMHHALCSKIVHSYSSACYVTHSI